MPEVACTFSSPDQWPELANCSTESANRSLGSFAKIILELAVEQLDGVEIRRVLREVTHRRSHLPDLLLDACDLVGFKVVQHDDVFAPQGWNQALFDIGSEHLSVHRPLDNHRGGQSVVAQTGHVGDRLPFAERDAADHPLAAGSAPPQPCHVGADAGLVDKYQPGWIKHALLSHPASPRAGYIGPLSPASCRLFFEGDAVSPEKPRKSTLAGSDPLLQQFRQGLLQGQIGLLSDESQYHRGMLVQRRYASSARLRRGAPSLVPALQPFDPRARTDAETLRSLAPRRPLVLDGFNHALPQVTGIGPDRKSTR